jgi:hypothetical protein
MIRRFIGARDMDPGIWIRFIIFVPIFIGAGVYCWRHGVRWSNTVTIKGPPAKIAAVILFALAGVMILAIIFPTQASQLVSSLDSSAEPPASRPPTK